MRAVILVFAAVVFFTVAGLAALDAAQFNAVQDGGERTPVLNETLTVDNGVAQTLSEGGSADRAYSSKSDVEVRDSGGNLVPADEYRWNDRNGSITLYSGGELTDGEQARVTYAYMKPTNTQNATAQVVTIPMNSSVLMFFAALLIIAAFFALMRVM